MSMCIYSEHDCLYYILHTTTIVVHFSNSRGNVSVEQNPTFTYLDLEVVSEGRVQAQHPASTGVRVHLVAEGGA